MELNEKILKKAKEIAADYPMPPGSITEEDCRAMMEEASIQLAEWSLFKESFTDWNSVRISAAISVLNGFCANSDLTSVDTISLAAWAVRAADQLVSELKEKEVDNEEAI